MAAKKKKKESLYYVPEAGLFGDLVDTEAEAFAMASIEAVRFDHPVKVYKLVAVVKPASKVNYLEYATVVEVK